jgi:hypothetical protein
MQISWNEDPITFHTACNVLKFQLYIIIVYTRNTDTFIIIITLT